MKFGELIDSISWDELKDEPLLYVSDDEEYRKRESEEFLLMFSRLIRMEPVETDMRIVIKETYILEDPDEIEEYDETVPMAYGRNGTLNKDFEDFEYLTKSNDPEFANAEADYNLQCVAWEKWLGMEIDRQTLESYTPTQIAACCMVDMSLFGFERELVYDEVEGVRRDLEELKKMTPAEKKAHPKEVSAKVHYEKILFLLD